MANVVLIGAQWGDEGKGKIIDFLAADSDVIVRSQGGNNAGHTVEFHDRRFILHLIPSGILNGKGICVISNGVVVDPEILIQEIETLKKEKIKTEGRLYISTQCHVIFPYHKLIDSLKEQKKGKNKIGTTKRGIGPCYADKISRTGIRLGDLMYPKVFEKKLKQNIKEKNQILKNIYGHKPLSAKKIYDEYLAYGRKLKKYLLDTGVYLNKAIKSKKKVLFEGAQGTLLDIDHGTYPFVTSSNATSGGAITGSGVGPNHIDHVIGVIKAYTTRVGEGPFPTEFEKKYMDYFRKLGGEFGATTGRPRRCGWFDAVIARYAVMINGIDKLVVTKMDILDTIPKIKVCVGYKYKGKVLEDFPVQAEVLESVTPVYREFPGWCKPTSHIRRFEQLPSNAKKYLKFIEKFVDAKISIVSVGSNRAETIIV